MHRTLALMAIGTALLTSRAAAAQVTDEAQARIWFQQGAERYDERKFEEALHAFQQADRLNPSWKIAFNIGQCQAALKRYGLAIEAFERYLAEGGDEVPDDRRSKVLDELSQFRKMVGGVMVKGEDGVVVVIDGIPRGSTPMNQPILVTAGVPHHVELFKQEALLRAVRDTVRGESTLEIDLAEESAPAPAPVVDTGGPGQPAPPPEVDEGGVSPVWFWVGLGATVVFASGAVASNFAVEKKKKDGLETKGELESAETVQALGITSLALAGAAGITTCVLAIFTDWDGDEEQPADIQVGAFGTGDGAGLVLEGSF